MKLQQQKRKIAHIDLDAFFASVEIRDNPSLKGKAVIIGNIPPARGVVSTCSYEARKYGIKSGMPVRVAQFLCPQAIFIKPNMSKYSKISKDIFGLLQDYCSDIYITGIDEAYLNLTGMVPLYSSYENLLYTIKNKIYEKFSLTSSIGLSSCPLISKMASDRCKPNGILILNEAEEEDFIMFSPIEEIPFFGKKLVRTLHGLNIFYFKDLYKYDLAFLEKKVGSFIEYFYLKKFLFERLKNEENTKSFSVENTFDSDINFSEDLFSTIAEFTQQLSFKLRDNKLKANTISTKVRDEDFTTYQRQTTIKVPTIDENLIANIAYRNLENIAKTKLKNKKIRLIGIKVSGLVKDSPNLFDMIEKDDIIYQKIDELNKKYGKPIIRKGIIWRKKD